MAACSAAPAVIGSPSVDPPPPSVAVPLPPCARHGHQRLFPRNRRRDGRGAAQPYEVHQFVIETSFRACFKEKQKICSIKLYSFFV